MRDPLKEFRELTEKMKRQGLIRNPGDPVVNPVVTGKEVKGVSTEWVDVTPEIAKGWLAKNPQNRTLRRATVDAYAADMRDGNWLPTHQGIAIDAEGWLLDGQHRLTAVVESGCTVRMLVTRGLAPEVKGKRISTIEAVDRGAARTVKDFLKVRGLSSPFLASAVAAVIAQICAYPDKQGRVTMNQTLAILELYREQVEWVGKNEPQAKAFRAATVLGPIAFAHAVAPEATEIFFEGLVSGAGLNATNPALHCRNWLMEDRTRYNRGNNSERLGVARRVLACLSYHAEKRPLKSIRELDLEVWAFFVEAQKKDAQKVRTILGKAGVS